MNKIIAKSLTQARKNLKISREYYNRNMVVPNYMDIKRAEKEVKYFESKRHNNYEATPCNLHYL